MAQAWECDTRMALTDTRIRNAKPAEKPYKVADGGGLYIEIKPTGTKLWRLRYRLAGKENVYAIGDYRLIGLAEARVERDKAKRLIKQGVHPSHQRKFERKKQAHEHANTFEAVATEWLTRNTGHWTAKTCQQRKRGLERDVFPYIGCLPVRQVTPAHVLDVVSRIEKRAPSIAALLNQAIGAICRYAVATLRADIDPTNPLRGSLRPRQTQHHKPLTASELPNFIKALEAYPGYFSNKIALHLMLLTLVRTTEALEAKWSEFDLDRQLWVIPAGRMKMREAHTVPFSRQVVDLLKRLWAVTGNSEYLFPSRSNLRKPASKGVLWKAVSSMGYAGRFSPHGIRATGATILNEMGYRPDVIERQLAHKERNKVRASYNRAEYLPERQVMMQAWADYLDGLTSDANVIPLRAG
jgi:integrase